MQTCLAEDLQLPQTKNETPATVEPNATASTPATVESDPTASTPTQPSTRSGRKVHLPTRQNLLLLCNERSDGHLSGHVNAHNVHIRSLENPHEVLESQRDSPKLNVFCAISWRKVYGPFVFGEPIVTGSAYLEALQLWLVPTGVASSKGSRTKIPSGPFFRYGSPVSGTVVTHVGALVAWEPRIFGTVVATPLLFPQREESEPDNFI
ncbi:uncharacterized protein TNCV_245761 [Trichonephila clavipes]|nr:uncharacterized protein TNCV_245761 [Trichonephila clavipes]